MHLPPNPVSIDRHAAHHCRWCQRETSTAHALNALYEADRVVHTAVEPEIIDTPSTSGRGQEDRALPHTCKVAIWSTTRRPGGVATLSSGLSLALTSNCSRENLLGDQAVLFDHGTVVTRRSPPAW
jgi:hypothetical protein